jgi:predicted CxxxxCH...CXXCH cytochrome family protein
VTTTDGTSINDKSQHVDQTKNVDWGALNSGADNYTDAATSCSNLYCHSDGQGAAPLTPVQWDTVPGSFGCNDCHDEAVAGTTLSGSHAAHFNGATLQTIGTALGCVDCHGTTVSDNTTLNATTGYANHVDGTKTLNIANFGTSKSTCAAVNCHSNGNYDGDKFTNNDPTSAWASGGYDCDSCHGDGGGNAYPIYNSGLVGSGNENSHNQHVVGNGNNCGECHSLTSTVGTAIDGSVPSAHVNNTVNVALLTGNWSNDASKTCSATYCHDSGTPQWGGTVNCGDCHAADKTLPASHATHYNSGSIGDRTVATKVNDTNNYVFQCGTCHSETPHADGTKQVVINSATWGGADAFAANTCDNLYCHSDGTSTTGPYTVNNAPVWNSSVMACGSCHEATPTTGKHTAHVADGTIMTDKSCEVCHSVTTTDGTSINDNFTHVNQVKDVDVNDTYNSATTGFASSTCSAVYCHSDGKSNYYDIAWSASITDCVGCHGGAGGSNGGAATALSTPHTVHTGTDVSDGGKQFNFNCETCHTETAADSSTIGTPANHVNTTVDVAVNSATFGGTGTIDGDYGAATAESCATTNCHGSASPTWSGSVTTGDCSACHGMAADPTDGRDTNGNTANNDPQVGAHVAHLSKTVYNIAGNLSCAECHKTTVDAQTAATSYVDKVNATGHIDSSGPAEIFFGSMANNSGTLSPD